MATRCTQPVSIVRLLLHPSLWMIAFSLAGCFESNLVRVTVQVVVPPGTPSDAVTYIAGNLPALGMWKPDSIPLTRENDSTFRFTGLIPKETPVEFKITRGSWATEAIYQAGVVPQNTKLRPSHDTVVVLRPISWKDREMMRQTGGVVGTVRYHRNLRGEGLRYPRDVLVWLPPSYNLDSTRRYPVLYMHDGQNAFDPSTSFLGYDWRADDVADSLIRVGAMEEIIIVAITNTPDRVSEYSDTPLGRAYARFVIEHVKPMVDSTYRTLRDARNTAVMGSSMGGLISFLFAWWYPDVFSQAACLSSAFLWDENAILREVAEYNGPRKPIRVYIDVGSEGLEEKLRPGYEEMVQRLTHKGFQKGVDLEYYFDAGAEHNEPAWANRLWRPLLFMFGKSRS